MEIGITIVVLLSVVLVLFLVLMAILELTKDRVLIIEEGLVFYVKRLGDDQYLSNREDYWWSEKFRFNHCSFDTKQEAIDHLRKFYPEKQKKLKQNVVEVLKINT